MSEARTPLEEARLVGASPMFAAMRELSDRDKYKRLDADFMAAHWWEVWDALLVSLARIEALERALSQETPPAIGRIYPAHLLAWGEQIRQSQHYESALSAWLTRLGREWAALPKTTGTDVRGEEET